MVVAFADGSVFLLATEAGMVLFAFERQPVPVQSVVWLPSQPGNFLTSNSKNGTLSLWNVSQPKPLEKLKGGNSPILNMVSFHTNSPEKIFFAYTNGSLALMDFVTNTGTGGVGATKVTSLRPGFTTSPAHSETIFDLVFNPVNCNVFATASYDGYVKLWNVAKKEAFREIFANDGILYALAFSRDGSMIAAVSGSGNLFVWKSETGAQILKYKPHEGSHASYRLQWHPDDPKLIATGGCDSQAVITNIAEKCARRQYRHPMVVIGVAFNPVTTHLLCTACQDCQVRIWDTQVFPHHHQPLLALVGHTARVFNVAWHPQYRNLLASGSDDTTIRVWDIDSQRECTRLCGHRSFVRALCWHSEVTQILLSGSWDATIRVWDASQGMLLYTARQHHADVYGLHAHPLRPFLFISSSRDTTIRYWSLEEIAAPFLLSAVLNPQELREMVGVLPAQEAGPEFFCSAKEEPLSPFLKYVTLGGMTSPRCPVRFPNSDNLLLFGHGFRHTLQKIENLPPHPQRAVRVYRMLFHFFSHRANMDDLWGLLEKSVGAAASGDNGAPMIGGPGGATGLSPGLGGTPGGDAMLEVHMTNACTAPGAAKTEVDLVTGRAASDSMSPNYRASGIGAGAGGLKPGGGANTTTTVWHHSVVCAQVRAQALALASNAQVSGGGAGGIVAAGSAAGGKKEDRLQRAAQMMLRIGDVRQYCEMMAAADKWEQAIMAAPMVSTEYWQRMHREYLSKRAYCLTTEAKAVALLATENAGELVEGYLREGMPAEALVASKAATDGLYFRSSSAGGGTPSSLTGTQTPTARRDGLPTTATGGVIVGNGAASGSRNPASLSRDMTDVARGLARTYYTNAEPVAAACMFFSVNMVQEGLNMLLKGNEVLLYHICHKLLIEDTGGGGGGSSASTATTREQRKVAIEWLAKQCERYHLQRLAVDLWNQSQTAANRHRVYLIHQGLRCPRSLESLLHPHSDLRKQFEASRSVANFDAAEAIKLALLVGEGSWAAQTALDTFLLEIAAGESGNFDKLQEISAVLESCNLTQLNDVNVVVSLLACAAYVAFVQAFLRGYFEILPPLAHTVQNIVNHRQLPFPVPTEELFVLEAIVTARARPREVRSLEKLNNARTTAERLSTKGSKGLVSMIDQHLGWLNSQQPESALHRIPGAHWLLDRLPPLLWDVELSAGPSLQLEGSFLPAERDAAVSVLSSEPIKGPSFLLEDGQHCVSLREATLWSRVNTCSPLNTGYPIMPY
ncbi:unnamed protein product [Amoebophrya sp. A25]|nr:unnamed protein product [Amoebophrya sp. A25]|eukprot:GSA25T00013778001.1